VSYGLAGRGPGGARYDPTPITAHHRLLPRFLAQIPPDAAVTATAAVHPHVSHRRYVYQFPTGLEAPVPAEWALLDVTTATDMAPGDVRSTVETMLDGEWGVVDAADGFLLLRRGVADKAIPPAFYDFARSQGAVTEDAPPLAFAGVDVLDWPRWRQTWLTTHWQVGPGYDAATMAPALAVRSPAQDTFYRFADAMPPALVWYPPEQWQPGDTVHATTLPLYLPRSWGVTVEQTPGLAWPPAGTLGHNAAAALVAALRRDGDGSLQRVDAALGAEDAAARLVARTPAALPQATGRFTLLDGGDLALTARLAQAQVWPGAALDLWLQWAGAGWPQGVDAFVHLRRDGENQDQQDGTPRLFVDYAIGQGQDVWLDWRQLAAPGDVQPGEWTIAVGLYDPATGQRLLAADGSDEIVLGPLEFTGPPVPDQACALVPAACASQP
jgi:hypothetical protein